MTVPALPVPNPALLCAPSDLCKGPDTEGQGDGWPGVKCKTGTALWIYRKVFKLSVCNKLGIQ